MVTQQDPLALVAQLRQRRLEREREQQQRRQNQINLIQQSNKAAEAARAASEARQQQEIINAQIASYQQQPQVQQQISGETPFAGQQPVQPQEDERFEFGTFFSSGVLENVAKAAVDVIDPVLNTAVGLGARALPGDQEFDKQLRAVKEERETQGKPGGLRGFLAEGTEASRRANPLQRGAEMGAATAFSLGTSLIPGNQFDGAEKEFQERRKKYFEEETGKDWDSNRWLNPNADIRAAMRAYRDTDLPKYWKGTLEFIFDPVNLVPGIGIVNDIKTGAKGIKATALAGPRLAQAGVGVAPTVAKAVVSPKETLAKAAENIRDRTRFNESISADAGQITYQTVAAKEQSLNRIISLIEETAQKPLSEVADNYAADIAKMRQEIDAFPWQDNTIKLLFEDAIKTGQELSQTKRNLTNFNKALAQYRDEVSIAGRLIDNRPGVYDNITGLTDATKVAVDADDVTKTRAVADGLNARAESEMARRQASSVQGIIRDVFNYVENSKVGAVSGAIKTVVGSITPSLLADITKPSIMAERVKYAFNLATAATIASTNAEALISKIGTSARVFGDSIDGSIVTLSAKDAEKVRRSLQSRYTPETIKTVEVEPNRFHYSDLVAAVVDVQPLRTRADELPGAVEITELAFDIKPQFKTSNNLFYNADTRTYTAAGYHLIETAKTYGELAKMLDEAGIAVRRGDTVLTGIDRVNDFITNGAHASRYAYNKAGRISGVGNNQKALESFYNAQRSLIDPDDLLEAVDTGRVAYATPEDTLKLYMQGAYKNIVNNALDQRMIDFFANNPELAAKYGVSVTTGKTGEGFRLIAGGRKGEARLASNPTVQKDVRAAASGEVKLNTPERQLFNSLVFDSEASARKFAKDFDILLDADNNDLVTSVKLWTNRSSLVRGAADVSRIFRFAGTGIDLGTMAIYAPIVLGKANYDVLAGIAKGDATQVARGRAINKAIANATVDAFLALATPQQIRSRTFSYARQAGWADAAEHGLTASRSNVEFFEALNSHGPITKYFDTRINSKFPGQAPIQKYIKGFAGRFELSFSTFIDEMKFGTYKALTQNADEATKRSVADFLNKATGTMDSAASGLSQTQRQLESAFLFFSSRMTRSMIALLSDSVTRGGIEGQMARQGVLTAWLGLQGMTWAMGQALGQDVELDPTQAHYLQIKIGNTWVGPSGNIISIPRAAMRAALGPDDKAAVYNEMYSDGSYKDNPWFQLLRSRAFTSPTGSMLMDAITNENYMGEPYEGLTDLVTAQSRNLLPFWLQDAVVADPYRSNVAGTAAAAFGLRTRPQTAYEARRDLMNDAAKELFSGVLDYENLDPLSKRKVITELQKEDSSLSMASQYAVTNELINEQRQRANVDGETIDTFYSEVNELKDRKDSELQELFNNYERNQFQTPKDLREMVGEVNSKYSPQFRDIYDPEGKYSEPLYYITVLDSQKQNEDARSIWIETYKNEVFYNSEFEKTNIAGADYFDYEARSQQEQQWINQYGTEAYEYVQEYFNAGKITHPVMQELNMMREQFRWYWEVPKNAAISNAVIKFNLPEAQVRQLYDLYINGSDIQKNTLNESEVIKYINNFSTKTKKLFREQNPALDGFLYRFGYNDTLTEANRSPSAEVFWKQKTPYAADVYASFAEMLPTG